MPKKRVLSEQDFMSEYWGHFGVKKGMVLLGWAVLLSAQASKRKETPREMRERLVREGRARSGAYRALADLRSLGEKLERENKTLPEWEKEDLQELARRVVLYAQHAA